MTKTHVIYRCLKMILSLIKLGCNLWILIFHSNFTDVKKIAYVLPQNFSNQHYLLYDATFVSYALFVISFDSNLMLAVKKKTNRTGIHFACVIKVSSHPYLSHRFFQNCAPELCLLAGRSVQQVSISRGQSVIHYHFFPLSVYTEREGETAEVVFGAELGKERDHLV